MKQLVLCILTSALVLSCSKKSSNNNTNPGNNNQTQGATLNENEKQVIGNWAIERIVDSNYFGVDLEEVIDGVPYPCRQDDQFVFNADKTYYNDEGADTCGSGGGPYGALSWSIDMASSHFSYKHGPGLIHADGTFRKIDNNHFAVYATRYWHDKKSTIRTYYYKRV